MIKMTSQNEWSDLEVFSHVGAKIGSPQVTISARKSITLSSGFLHHAKNQVSGMSYAILSFSKSKKAIVFSFADNKNLAGSTKITLKGNAIIAARAFFNYYNIDSEKADGRYIAKLENIPNIGERWVVYLDQKLS